MSIPAEKVDYDRCGCCDFPVSPTPTGFYLCALCGFEGNVVLEECAEPDYYVTDDYCRHGC